jgi:hypothetical protein
MKRRKIYRLAFRLAGFRKRRMRKFAGLMRPSDSTTILDVGGTLRNWKFLDIQPQITLLNIDPAHNRGDYPDHIRFQQGDALGMPLEDKSYDIAFSNSVIEHLHSWENQQRFASEVRRVGSRQWVQTPAREFFIEPHLLTPFNHWLPPSWRRRLLRNLTVWGWIRRPSKEEVDAFLSEVRLLSYSEMEELFPECTIHKEKWLGMTKSYIAYTP